MPAFVDEALIGEFPVGVEEPDRAMFLAGGGEDFDRPDDRLGVDELPITANGGGANKDIKALLAEPLHAGVSLGLRRVVPIVDDDILGNFAFDLFLVLQKHIPPDAEAAAFGQELLEALDVFDKDAANADFLGLFLGGAKAQVRGFVAAAMEKLGWNKASQSAYMSPRSW